MFLVLRLSLLLSSFFFSPGSLTYIDAYMDKKVFRFWMSFALISDIIAVWGVYHSFPSSSFFVCVEFDAQFVKQWKEPLKGDAPSCVINEWLREVMNKVYNNLSAAAVSWWRSHIVKSEGRERARTLWLRCKLLRNAVVVACSMTSRPPYIQ